MIDLEGTYRDRLPKETFELVSRDMYEKYGITRLANITGLDSIGVPVYIAIRPNSKSLSVSQGKGVTHELAKVSAVMEAIEVWYAENMSNLNVVVQSVYESDSLMVSPALFTTAEYKNHVFNWVEVTNLIDEKTSLLPQKLFSLDTVDTNHTIFNFSSNGLASGNNLDEAIIHSVCELVERDATSKWYEKSEAEQDQCLLDLKTVHESTTLCIIEKILQQGLKLFVWDITTFKQISTYYCALVSDSTIPHTLFTGQGAHVDSNVALNRAITEACQARLTYISGSRDDVFPQYYQESRIDEAMLQNLSALTPEVDYERKKPVNENLTSIKTEIIKSLQQMGVKNLYMYQHFKDETKAVVHVKSSYLREVDK
jgi:ribosomal protein S12 methylthiotransferase accessory factor